MHIEPDEQGVRVRIRVDGLLQQLCVLPRTQQSHAADAAKGVERHGYC
mgnify:CR=1 FL=1